MKRANTHHKVTRSIAQVVVLERTHQAQAHHIVSFVSREVTASQLARLHARCAVWERITACLIAVLVTNFQIQVLSYTLVSSWNIVFCVIIIRYPRISLILPQVVYLLVNIHFWFVGEGEKKARSEMGRAVGGQASTQAREQAKENGGGRVGVIEEEKASYLDLS